MASNNATATKEAGILVASKRVIYVGGLGDTVTPQVLRSAMIPFGDIKSLDIPMDYKVGKTRGFAFVEFDDPEDGRLCQARKKKNSNRFDAKSWVVSFRVLANWLVRVVGIFKNHNLCRVFHGFDSDTFFFIASHGFGANRTLNGWCIILYDQQANAYSIWIWVTYAAEQSRSA